MNSFTYVTSTSQPLQSHYQSVVSRDVCIARSRQIPKCYLEINICWHIYDQDLRSSNERYKKDKERYQFSEQQKRMEEAG